MNYKVTFRVDEAAYECFKAESDLKKRFKLDVKKRDGNVDIIIDADDVGSLKAITGSMIKLIGVYEQLRGLK
jgi:tRNA threonylcarbamoyladenosine modification (KEOPS) complex  Pcc1 subunit